MYKYIHEIIFIIVGAVILLINFMYVAAISPFLFPILNVIGGLLAVVPPTLIFYTRYKKSKQMEQQFLIFIKDLTESINTGMTLPMALKNVSKKNYYTLASLVNNLAAQVDWGIPFEKALTIFAKGTRSILIQRSITTIIQTYRVGGKIAETLTSIGQSLLTIENIRKERSTSVKTQVVTSYMIYFIFIMILVTLQVFLIPSLNFESTEVTGLGTVSSSQNFSSDVYAESFIIFIIIQGLFAGLVTGKLSEGTLTAGFKHSILLIVVGYTIFSLASQLNIALF
ncbi:MAG: type II secretion system F family protein [Candidatus Aenigmatarchaeota archaeon]|nr:type II secretion system F family protein [Nanoarchaeota archaeon]